MIESKVREILAELDITLPVPGRNGWFNGACPFAQWEHAKGVDRSPSFGVHTGRGVSGFKCFTCQAKGNLYSLVKRLEYLRGETYGDLAYRALAYETPAELAAWEEFGLAEEEQMQPLDAALFSGMYPYAWETAEARDYLIKRGITEYAATRMQTYYDPEEFRVLVPIYDRGRNLYGFTGRTILPEESWPNDPRYKKSKDYGGLRKANCLMNLQNATPDRPTFVVEGWGAVARLLSIGADQYANIVASMGASISLAQRDLLLGLGTGVFLCFDNDDAGNKGLFGPWDSMRNRFEGGAIELLREHLPTFLPQYTSEKPDVDLFDLPDFLLMLRQNFVVC